MKIANFDFLTHKYGSELLIDIGRIETLPGYVLSDQPHRLTFYEILFATGGAGEFALDLDSYEVEPGRIFFTSPGQVRQWRLSAPAEGVTLFFTGDFISEFFNDPLFLNKVSFFHNHRQPLTLTPPPADFDVLLGRLVEMEREIRSLRGDSVHMLRAILYQLLVQLNRIFGAEYGTEPDTEAHPLYSRFRSLLEAHYREWHSVAEYARSLHVTPGHLSDVTRRQTGSSAGALIHGRLVAEARRLILYSDEPVHVIGKRLGFEDPSYFGRFFRQQTGLSPLAYRRSALGSYQDRRNF